jgi:hypothetical protein
MSDPNDGELYRLFLSLDGKIDGIYTQVKTTNGRVTNIELREQYRDGQLSIIKWLVGIVAGGLIALTVAVAKKWIGA